MKNIEDMTEDEILAEYKKRYPKKERESNNLFEFYSGKNNINIKYKDRTILNFFMERGNLDTLFVDSKYDDFWNKINNSDLCHLYLWGCSVLIDFGDNFYYELGVLDQEIVDSYNSNKNKIKISKYNIELDNLEESFEFDIIVL